MSSDSMSRSILKYLVAQRGQPQHREVLAGTALPHLRLLRWLHVQWKRSSDAAERLRILALFWILDRLQDGP